MASTREALPIGFCCMQEVPIKDSSSVIRLTFLSNISMGFHLHLSVYCEIAGVGVNSSYRAEAAMFVWIPVVRNKT